MNVHTEGAEFFESENKADTPAIALSLRRAVGFCVPAKQTQHGEMDVG